MTSVWLETSLYHGTIRVQRMVGNLHYTMPLFVTSVWLEIYIKPLQFLGFFLRANTNNVLCDKMPFSDDTLKQISNNLQNAKSGTSLYYRPKTFVTNVAGKDKASQVIFTSDCNNV